MNATLCFLTVVNPEVELMLSLRGVKRDYKAIPVKTGDVRNALGNLWTTAKPAHIFFIWFENEKKNGVQGP